MTNNKITVRGILRGGKTLVLTEDTELPEHLPDLPVTVQIELPVGVGLLQAYGAWKDMPGIENIDQELEELRYGKRPYEAETTAQDRVAQVEAWMAAIDAVAESIEGEFDSAEDIRVIRAARADRL